METNAQENELIELERSFWKALQRNDIAAAEKLSDFPVLLTGPQGVGRVDRDTFVRMMGSPSYTIDDYTLSDIEARRVSDDVGVVAYRVQEKLTVDGKPVELEVVDSSTWVKRGGQWLCAQHAEAIVGDPFGRDRQPAPNPGAQPDLAAP